LSHYGPARESKPAKQTAEPTFADLGYNGITQSRARDADVHADPYQCGDNQERHRINLS